MPSNIYNKKKHVRDSRYWTEGYNFEWGHGFELREVSADLIGDGMKSLTFSQCCKVLYWWSNGMSICVGVFNYLSCKLGGVLINPERHIKIGDCASIFVICNDFEKLLAMLGTNDMDEILKSLYTQKARTFFPEVRPRRRELSKLPSFDAAGVADLESAEETLGEIPASLSGAPILLNRETRVRTDSHWMMSWMNPSEHPQEPETTDEEEYRPNALLEFKRGPRCFRIEAMKRSGRESEEEKREDSSELMIGSKEPSISAGESAPNIVRRKSFDSLAATVGTSNPPVHRQGRFLSFLPEPCVVYGDDETVDTSQYLIPKQFSDHGIVKCYYFNLLCPSY